MPTSLWWRGPTLSPVPAANLSSVSGLNNTTAHRPPAPPSSLCAHLLPPLVEAGLKVALVHAGLAPRRAVSAACRCILKLLAAKAGSLRGMGV